MIIHKYKLIFLHNPKCAGVSIENFFGSKLDDPYIKNENQLLGWCESRKLHLQHLTAKDFLDVVGLNVWDEYIKFTTVRNPYDRAYSGYLWLNKTQRISGDFLEYLRGEGPYKLYNNPESRLTRGCHLKPQHFFSHIGNKLAVDYVLKVENLDEDWFNFLKSCGIPFRSLSKANKTNKQKTTTQFYNSLDNKKEVLDFIQNKYKKDFKLFGYSSVVL